MNDLASGENSDKKTSFLSTPIWGKTLKESFGTLIFYSLCLNTPELWDFYKARQWDKFINEAISGFVGSCVVFLLLCIWVYLREALKDDETSQHRSP